MGEFTSAVSDEQLISHFKEVIVPYCVSRQLPVASTTLSTSSPTSNTDEVIIQTLEKSLVDIIPKINDEKTVSH